jgi:excisionase family DNA binding protein
MEALITREVVAKSRRLNVDEAAEYTGIAKATLNKYRVTKTPAIPFMKIGRRVVYDTADLDAFLESRRRTSTSDAISA